ncbi:hypothetical protein RhiirA4_450851 [Rhizophagus irregularis]|uniref:Uncharacterized protein n=1 Tax=Rhizophagus irregularis TaxID=588596 RepID=A0A2I1FU84_9GLOM|nr:hypothetical protein RhiirA4_450851 [Rhizophagus irregularis]
MCIADWNKNEIKELRLKYKIIEEYLLTEGIKDDKNEIKETVEKIRKILNKSDIGITEDDIIRIINFGFSKHVLGIKFMNIRHQDCEPLSQLIIDQYPTLYREFSSKNFDYYGITDETSCPLYKLDHNNEENIEDTLKDNLIIFLEI